MNEKKDKDTKPAKKRGRAGIILKAGGAIALLGLGGGGVFALVATGVIGGGAKLAIKGDKNPKLIRKGASDPFTPAAKEGDGDGKTIDGDGGSEYRTLYFSFSDDFTSNLKGSGSLVQMSIACSTHRDYRVLLWLKKHELAIRSAMLAVLADTDEADGQTPRGKDALQRRLTQSINKVLTDAEGFGGVDAVYFKTFIIQ